MLLTKRELWCLVLLSCASLLCSAWLVRPTSVEKNSPPSKPADVVPPSDDSFASVHAVLQPASAANRQQLAAAWRDLAWVLERDQMLQTTSQLRQTIVRFEALLFAKTNLAGAFPGFSAAANACLLERLGADDQPLDRAAAVAALQDLAAACFENKESR